MGKYWDDKKDKWIGDEIIDGKNKKQSQPSYRNKDLNKKGISSVKDKSRSQTAKGYSEGVESGFKAANKVFSPVVSSTGKQRIKNIFKSSKYKEGFEKGRKESVNIIKKQADKYKREELGLIIDPLRYRRTGFK